MSSFARRSPRAQTCSTCARSALKRRTTPTRSSHPAAAARKSHARSPEPSVQQNPPLRASCSESTERGRTEKPKELSVVANGTGLGRAARLSYFGFSVRPLVSLVWGELGDHD